MSHKRCIGTLSLLTDHRIFFIFFLSLCSTKSVPLFCADYCNLKLGDVPWSCATAWHPLCMLGFPVYDIQMNKDVISRVMSRQTKKKKKKRKNRKKEERKEKQIETLPKKSVRNQSMYICMGNIYKTKRPHWDLTPPKTHQIISYLQFSQAKTTMQIKK